MNQTRTTIVGLSTLVAPLGFVLGWSILMVRAGQGADFGWFLSHVLLLAGAVLIIPAVLGLSYPLNTSSPGAADISLTLSFLGAMALVGQFAIDLAVGHLSSSQAEMSSMFRRLATAPIIRLPFHLVGPILFYLGLLMLIISLLRARLIPQWAGTVAIAGIIAVGSGVVIRKDWLTFLGFVGLWIGCMPIGWNLLVDARQATLRSPTSKPTNLDQAAS
jgi:hypothetical protein